MDHEKAVSGEAGAPVCTHGDDAAVHVEYQAWAEGWAKKLHDEAPPEADGHDAHLHHELARIWRDEVLANFPERFRGCVLYPKHLIKDALLDLHFPHDASTNE